VYLGLPPGIGEPPKRLVTWQKVFLQPGELRHVTLTVAANSTSHPLSYWDVNSNSWQNAPGDYTVYVGNSSRNVTPAGTFHMDPPASQQAAAYAAPAISAAADQAAEPGITFKVTPTVIEFGRSAALKWSITGANSCVASGDWLGPRQAKGSVSVTPPAPGFYNYVLTCTGEDSSVSRSVPLEVQAPDGRLGHPRDVR
jgi:hypothetical protein